MRGWWVNLERIRHSAALSHFSFFVFKQHELIEPHCLFSFLTRSLCCAALVDLVYLLCCCVQGLNARGKFYSLNHVVEVNWIIWVRIPSKWPLSCFYVPAVLLRGWESLPTVQTDNWTQMQPKNMIALPQPSVAGDKKRKSVRIPALKCVLCLCCNVFTLDARLLTVCCFARLCQTHRRAANELAAHLCTGCFFSTVPRRARPNGGHCPPPPW